jgi:hypothetical protein
MEDKERPPEDTEEGADTEEDGSVARSAGRVNATQQNPQLLLLRRLLPL